MILRGWCGNTVAQLFGLAWFFVLFYKSNKLNRKVPTEIEESGIVTLERHVHLGPQVLPEVTRSPPEPLKMPGGKVKGQRHKLRLSAYTDDFTTS